MFIIGIAGGTGSGKTTIANQIINKLPQDEACIIPQDSYYNKIENLSYKERAKINFDHPSAIDFKLLISHITNLKNNKTIKQPIYSFIKHNRAEKSIKISPKKIIIVEGILIFNNVELRKLFDLKIFIDTDADERLIRRIYRDKKERDRNIDETLNRYQNTLKPMHQQFVEPSKKYADIIIPNNKQNTVAVDIFRTLITNKI
ncbi:uridine kinase [Tenacibaculum aestuariivivum]|uniref:uridine kinase n=1 Tax=Tenacibaculum aestuariivivum TaxID=2006131 RepID=UPI003AB8FE8C